LPGTPTEQANAARRVLHISDLDERMSYENVATLAKKLNLVS
jgi:hypothetical protein